MSRQSVHPADGVIGVSAHLPAGVHCDGVEEADDVTEIDGTESESGRLPINSPIPMVLRHGRLLGTEVVDLK